MGSPVIITPDAPAQSGAPVTITPDPPASAAQPRTWKDSVHDAVSEWWNQVNPAEGLRGLDVMQRHPIDTTRQLLQGQGAVLDKAVDSFKNGKYVEGTRHFLNYLLPVIGQSSDKAGDQLQSGETAKGLGATAGIVTNIAAPAGVEAAAAKVAPTAGRALLLGRTPEGAYESALKPSTTLSDAERAAVVKTGLENKIPVSEAGLTKLNDLIDKTNAAMDAAIPKNTPATVNKFAVASRLGDVADRFRMQVNPESDLSAVGESRNEFLRNQPDEIPAKDAAAIKSGTYKQLGDKAYGELGTASKESQKALARGIKEELITQFPELEGLGLKDQQFYNLQGVLEKAVGRISNHDLVGISSPIAAGAAKAVTGSGGAAAAVGLMKAVLDNPQVKSRLAILVSKSGQIAPAAAIQRVNAYHASLGAALQSLHESGANPSQSPNQSTGVQP